MQILRQLILGTLVFCSFTLQAQFTISGSVVDSATHEPLVKASVFCQNTTSGTVTDKQGHFELTMKPGGYELIISYTGYQTQQIRVSQDNANLPVIGMIQEDKSLGEVVIKSSNEIKDGWEKYGSFFLENFIGTTPNAGQCLLQNPDVLKFYFSKKNNRLKVLASEPLLIVNKALGYELHYQLDSFVYYYETFINSYRGFCLYTAMDGSDSLKKVWNKNRANAYFGSRLQFTRSYYDSTLKEDGFSVGLLDETDPTKFIPVTDPYDTSYYGVLDSTKEVEVWFPRKFSVAYAKKRPEPEYLKKFKLPKNVAVQLSYIELRDAIDIQENGYFYDQKDWVNQGYWSWKNLADQLPYDYSP